MRENKTTLATLAALSTQVIFGFSFMFTKIALRYASPFTVIADRYILAFLGLTIAAWITGKMPRWNKDVWKVILMAVFQPVLYFIFETYGIKMTTSAFSSVIIALTPVVCMLVGIFALREIPAPVQYVFMALSVLGVVIMSYAGQSDGVVTLPGVLCLLGAVISSTVYVVISRKLSDSFSAFDRTYIMTVVGMIVFVLMALTENIHSPQKLLTPFLHAPYTWALLYLGILSSVVAFLFLNFANTYLPVAKTTVFVSVNMVVSVTAGIVFLNEPFSFETVIAAVMIVVGVCGVQVSSVKICKNE